MDKGKEFVFVALLTLALHYSSLDVPRHLSRFHTHPRWSPVTQSLRSRLSYGKIGGLRTVYVDLMYP